jgi:hypothetical protein
MQEAFMKATEAKKKSPNSGKNLTLPSNVD